MTTRVRGQVVFPNTSTPVNGAHIEIRAIGSTSDPSAPAYIPAASAEVFSPYKTAADDFGHWHADLTPSEDLVPVGCLYEVRYRWDGDVHGFYIEVPATPSEVWVGDITVPTNDILTGLRVRDLVGVTITDPQVDQVLGIIDVIDGVEIWGNIEQTGSGGGGGSALTVKLNGVTVDTAVTDLDFSSQFAATESPLHEINISVAALAASVVTSGTFAVERGGTGLSTITSNGVLIGDGTNAVLVSAAGAANQVFRVPAAGGTPAFGPLNLDASGATVNTLGLDKGGTDAATAAAARTNLGLAIGTDVQAFDADLSAIAAIATSVGSLILGGAGPTWVELPIGTPGQTLTVNGGGTTAEWATPGSGVTDHGLLTGLGDDDHTQYHNDARALTWLGTRSTTDLPEGTNEYYTNAKADARIAAAVGVSVQAFSTDLVDLIAQWFPADATTPANLHFHEATNNGIHRINLRPPASITADRQHTLPDVADDTFAMLAATQTLTNKTLTTPTVADFTNAQHDHLDADDGGTLSASAIASGTLDNARLDADLAAIANLATSVGSLILGGAGPTWVELPIGAAGTTLESDGTTAAWVAPTDIADLPAGARPDGTELVPASQSSNDVALTLEDFIAGPCDVASGPRGARYRIWEDFDSNVAANTTNNTLYGNQKTFLLLDVGGGAGAGAAANASITDLLAGHAVYGVGQLTTGTGATARSSITGLHAYYVFDRADTLRFVARVRIPTVSTTGVQQFITRIGLTDLNTGATPVQGGFYVEANTATNWQCYNDDDTTRTANDSGIAVSNAAYVNIGIHYDGSVCHFWMSTGNNPMTEVATEGNNRPDTGTTGFGPTVAIVKSVGTTARTLNIDGWGVDLPINRGLTFRL